MCIIIITIGSHNVKFFFFLIYCKLYFYCVCSTLSECSVLCFLPDNKFKHK